MVPVHAIPTIIDFQGKLTDNNNNPQEGELNMTFSIYNQSAGGALLWSENKLVNVTDSLFSTLLGSNVPINLTFGEGYYAGVVVAGETFTPRYRVATVPYAFRANISENAIAPGTTIPSFVISSIAGQTSNLTEWKNPAGSIVAWLNTSGYFNVSGGIPCTAIRGAAGRDFCVDENGTGTTPLSDNTTQNDLITGNNNTLTALLGQKLNLTGGTLSGLLTILSVAATNNLSLNVSGILYVNSSSGNVGIGTTGPSEKLEVIGSRLTNTFGSSDRRVSNFGETAAASGLNGYFQVYTTNLFGSDSIILGSGYGANSGLAFATRTSGAGTQGIRMTITGDGNVGIGTTGPRAKLDVNGSYATPGVNGFSDFGVMTILSTNAAGAGVGGVLVLGGETALGTTPNPFGFIQGAQQTVGEYGGYMSFHTVSSGGGGETNSANYERMRITKNGNVGIGTTGPNSKLEVNGTVNITGGLNVTAGGLNVISGNVGIGTTGPKQKFHINTGTNENLYVRTLGPGIGIETANDADNSYVALTLKATSYSIFANGARKIDIDSSGNVGIGTTGPSGILHTVTGGTYNWQYSDAYGDGYYPIHSYRATRNSTPGSFTATVNGNNLLDLRSYGSSASAFTQAVSIIVQQSDTAGTYTPANMIFSTFSAEAQNTNQLVLASTGNVGIGTTSPTARLDVNGTNSANNLSLNVNNILYANQSFVGVGTSSPSSRLDVSGTLTVEGINVTGRQVSDNTTIGSRIGSLETKQSSDNATVANNISTTNTRIGNLETKQSSDNTTLTGLAGTKVNLTASASRQCSSGEYIDNVTTVGGAVTGIVCKNQTGNNDNTTQNDLITGNNNTLTAGLGQKLNLTGGTLSGLLSITGNPSNAGNLSLSVNNTLYVNQSTSNVGIGTTGPGAKLEIQAPASAGTGYKSDYIKMYASDYPDYYGILRFDASGTGSLLGLSTGSATTQLGISTAGNILLNTVAFGTDAAKVLVFGAGTAPTTSPADVTQLWTADWNGAGTNALFMRTEEGTKHVFGSNVGIGTTSPGQILHINGASPIEIIQATGPGQAKQIRLLEPTSGGTKFNWMIAAQQNVDNAFEITPSTAANGTTFSTPALTILSTGNVGIGTTGPSWKLTVSTGNTTGLAHQNTAGSARITTDIVGDGGELKLYDTTNSVNAKIDSDGVTYFNGGNVGIGTTIPRSLLQVDGNASFNGTLLVEGINVTGRQVSDNTTIGSRIGSLETKQSSDNTTVANNISTTNTRIGNLETKQSSDNTTLTGLAGTKVNLTASASRQCSSGEYIDNVTTIGGAVTGIVCKNQTGSSDNNTLTALLGQKLNLTGGTLSGLLSITGNPSNAGNLSLSVNNTLYVNQSTSNVGIGTTNPGKKLDVSGDIALNNGNFIYLQAPSDSNWLIGKSTGHDIIISGGAGGDPSREFLLLDGGVSGTTRFSVNLANGNAYLNGDVGIGDTNPGAKLVVEGVNSANNLSLDVDDVLYVNQSNVGIGTTNPSAILHVRGNSVLSNTPSLRLEDTTGGTPFLTFADGATNKWNITLQSNNRFSFDYQGLEALTILSTGLIGIGDTNPGAKLVVEGVNSANNLSLDIDDVLYVNGSNVGIGTSSPAQTLHVIGDANITGTLYAPTIAASLTGLSLQVLNVSGQTLLATSTGNVGIGTTNPGALLDVNGTSRFDGTSIFRTTSGTQELFRTVWDGGNTGGIAAPNGRGLYLTGGSGTANTSGIFIDGSGDVGIGTTSPQNKLDVAGAGNFTGDVLIQNVSLFTRQSSDNTTLTALLGQKANLTQVNGFLNTTNNVLGQSLSISSGANSPNNVTLNVSNALYVNGSNVGIGTTGPSEKLEVAGSIRMDSSGDDTSIVFKNTGSSSVKKLTNFAGDNRFGFTNTAGAEYLTITNAGNVGIGTTIPRSLLQVDGNASFNGTLLVEGINVTGRQVSDNMTLGNKITTLQSDNTTQNDLITGNNNTLTGGLGTKVNLTASASRQCSSGEYVDNVTTVGGAVTGIVCKNQTGNNDNTTQNDLITGNNNTLTAGLGQKLNLTGGTLSGLLSITGNPSNAGNLSLSVNNTLYVNQSTSNVGIGTTGPGAKLVVYSGDFWIDSSTAQMNFRNSAVNKWAITASNDDLNFYDYSGTAGTRVTIQNTTGNVGIGTTGPQYKLDVLGGASGVQLRLAAAAGYGTGIEFTDGTAGAEARNWRIGTANSVAGDFAILRSSAAGVGASIPTVTILNSGNVGIGTTIPRSLLQVDGNASFNGTLLVEGINVTGRQVSDNTTIGSRIGSLETKQSSDNATVANNISTTNTRIGNLEAKQSSDNTTLTGLAGTKVNLTASASRQCSSGEYVDNVTTVGGAVTGIVCKNQTGSSDNTTQNDLITGNNNTLTAGLGQKLNLTGGTLSGLLSITGNPSNTGNLSLSVNNTLYVNQSTSNVGIGTTTPNRGGEESDDRTLTIESSSNNRAGNLELVGTQLQGGQGNDLHIDFVDKNGTSSYNRVATISAGPISLNSRGGALRFIVYSTNGVDQEVVTINSSGNVGIGTTGPNNKLEVIGSINSTGNYITTSASTVTTKTVQQYGHSNWSSGIQFNNDRTLSIWAGGNTYSNYPTPYIRGGSGGYLQLAGGENLIFGGGNNDPGGINGSLLPGVIRFRRTTGTTAGSSGGIYFADNNSADASTNKAFAIYPDDTNHQLLYIKGATSYTDSPSTTIMTFNASGNVGIGTTSPANTLHVVGTANITGGLNVSAGGLVVHGGLFNATGGVSCGMINGGTDGDFCVDSAAGASNDNTTQNDLINSNNNTLTNLKANLTTFNNFTAPWNWFANVTADMINVTTGLFSGGVNYITRINSNNQTIADNLSSTGTRIGNLETKQSADNTTLTGLAGTKVNLTASASRQCSSGEYVDNVTTVGGAVTGIVCKNQTGSSDNTTQNDLITGNNNTLTAGLGQKLNLTGGTLSGLLSITGNPSNAGNLSLSVNSTLYVNQSTSRVGVGTANPASSLDVNGIIAVAPADTPGSPGYTFNDDTNTGMYHYYADRMSFSGGGTELLRINGFAGNSLVTVEATSLELQSGTLSSLGLRFEGDSNTGIYNPTADMIGLATGGSERIRIDSTGRVGIGTTGPTARLEINGTNTANNLSLNVNNILYANTSADRIGIGTSSPGSRLDVSGTLTVEGINVTGRQVSDNTTIGSRIGSLETKQSSDNATVANNISTTNTRIGNLETKQSSDNTTVANNISTTNTRIGNLETKDAADNTTQAALLGQKMNISGGDFSGDVTLGSGFGAGGITLKTNGDILMNGTLYITENITNVNVQNLNVNGTIAPAFDAAYDIGTSTLRFVNGYFSGDVTINGVAIKARQGSDNTTIAANLSALATRLGNQITLQSADNTTVAGNISTTNTRIGNLEAKQSADNTTLYAQLGQKLNLTGGTLSGLLSITGNPSNTGNLSLSVNSTLYVNQSTGNVGIGTTNPAQKLVVAGVVNVSNGNAGAAPPANIEMFIEDDSDAELVFLSPNGNDGRIFFSDPQDDNIGGIIYQHPDNSMLFRVNDGTKAIIDSNGNVGIGTTSPTSLLHTNGSAVSFDISNSVAIASPAGSSANVLSLVNTNDTDNNTAGLKFGNGTTVYTAIETVFKTHAGGAADGILTFSTRGGGTIAERMRIAENGNVGIGTTGPITKLHATSADTTTQSVILATDSAGNTGSGVALWSGWSGGTPNQPAILWTAGEDLRIGGGITNFGGAGFAEYMRIKDGGNVGIGTTAPLALLDVFATTSPVLQVRTNGSDTNGSTIRLLETTNYLGGFIRYESSANRLDIGVHNTADSFVGNDSSVISIVRSTSNVGINTTAPTAKLDITGVNTANNLSLAVNNTLYVNASGRVGIGTAAPAATLTIEADKTSYNAAQTNIQLSLRGATTTTKELILGFDTTNNDGIIQAKNFGIAYHDLALQPEGGNVGIGTTAPEAILSVSRGTSDSGRVFLGASSSTGQTYIDLNNTSPSTQNVWSLSVGGSANAVGSGFYIYERSAGTAGTRFVISSGGNVGIGTNSPGSQLEVIEGLTNTAGAGALRLTRSATAGSNQSWNMRMDNSNGMNFDYYNTTTWATAVTVQSGGDVGINTTTPTAKLDVRGGVTISENLTVNSGKIYANNIPSGSANFVYYNTDTDQLIQSASSRRFKDNISDLGWFDMDKINKLRPVEFTWNNNSAVPNKRDFGLVAEEVYDVYPQVVGSDSNGQPLFVRYEMLSVLLLKNIQELNRNMSDVQSRLQTLEESNHTAGGDPGAGAAQSNKALCWTSTNAIGYCSSAVDSGGACTCNAIT